MSTKRGVPTPEPKAFGRVLRRLRRDRDWTQLELAERADISRKIVAEYESGRGSKSERPSYDVMEKIAKAFSMKPQELKALIASEESDPQTVEGRLGSVEAKVGYLGGTVDELLAQVRAYLKQSQHLANSAEPANTNQQKKSGHES